MNLPVTRFHAHRIVFGAGAVTAGPIGPSVKGLKSGLIFSTGRPFGGGWLRRFALAFAFPALDTPGWIVARPSGDFGLGRRKALHGGEGFHSRRQFDGLAGGDVRRQADCQDQMIHKLVPLQSNTSLKREGWCIGFPAAPSKSIDQLLGRGCLSTGLLPGRPFCRNRDGSSVSVIRLLQDSRDVAANGSRTPWVRQYA